MFKLIKSEVNKTYIVDVLEHVAGCDKVNFVKPAGMEWYKLLAYISTKVDNSTLLDIGTRLGASAVALAHNPNNKVLTYDVRGCQIMCKLPNVEFIVKNLLETDMSIIDDIPIIALDVDPHDGIKETEFLDKIRERNWKGILLMDDIRPPWNKMVTMWNEIPETKYDLTDIGHSSGTGLVDFGTGIKIIHSVISGEPKHEINSGRNA